MVAEQRAIPQMEPWYGPEEADALAAYVASGGWGTEFTRTRQFEELLADYIGSKYCVVTVNGTVALALAFMGLGIGPGDEVIVPDYTMIASATSVLLAGARPVLVDVDPRTLCVDVEGVARAITPRTWAIEAVSINGRAPDLVALQQLARERSLHLVEDAAQSLACRYRGAHLGTYGAAGCFSFSIHKLVSTGNGGAVVTDDEVLCQRMRLVKDFGRPTAGIDRHEAVGYNFKFTDFQAVVGIEQMKKLPARAERKKAIFARYRERLSEVAGVSFLATDLAAVTPWFMDILVEPGRRDPLAAYLKGRGIGTRPFYPAIHTQPPFADSGGAFPHSAEASARGLWLPSSPRLTDEDVDYVCEGVRDFFAGLGQH